MLRNLPFLILAGLLCCATGGTDTSEFLPPGVLLQGTVAVLPADGHDINVLLADEVRGSLPGRTGLTPLSPDLIRGAIPSYPHMPRGLEWDALEKPGIVPSRLGDPPGDTVVSLLSSLDTDYILVLWIEGVRRTPDANLPLIEEYTLDIRGYLADRRAAVLFISNFQWHDNVFFLSSPNDVAREMVHGAAQELCRAMGSDPGRR